MTAMALSQPVPRSPVRPHAPLTVFRLAGTQAEMGRQHGGLVREAGGADDVLAFYPRMPHKLINASLSSRPGDRVVNRLVPAFVERALSRLHRHRPAHLVARTEAFMRAVGAPAESVRYLAVMDTFQNIVGSAARFGLMTPAHHAAMVVPPMCSSLVAWGSATRDGQLLHARNFDFPGIGIWEQQPTVVFCTPDDGLRYGFVTAKGADVPGVTCFNEAGLCLDAHTRFHRDVSYSGATVVDIGHEVIRRARTIDEAVAIIKERTVASTWGFTVSSATEGRAVVVETTAKDVRVTRPQPDEPFLATTNRYHHPTLALDEVVPTPAFAHHCRARHQVLRHHAEAALATAGFTVHSLGDVLGDTRCPETGLERPAGGVVAQPETVQSVVIDPGQQCVWVSTGLTPTGRGPWTKVPFAWADQGASADRIDDAVDSCALPSRFEQGPAQAARAAFFQAVGQAGQAPRSEIRARLDEAVAGDPDVASYRFVAGALALSDGDLAVGFDMFAHALEDEPAGFLRGQLLLWAGRAADAAGHRTDARAFRAELLDDAHPLLGDHRRAALREQRRPVTADKLRGMPVGLLLVDAG